MFRFILPLVTALLLLGGTTTVTAADDYQSLWAQLHKLRPDLERGSMLGDFHWAANARNLKAATERWSIFLERHAPAPGEEADDATQSRFVRIARIELARVHYLSKRVREGDQLMKRLIEKP